MALFSNPLTRYCTARTLQWVRPASWLPWKEKEPKMKEQDSKEDTSQSVETPVDPRTGKARPGSNWHYGAELSSLAQRIGYDIKSLPSLRIALTDRQLLRNVPKHIEKVEEYSRLAVLGRSTMMFYVHEYLYHTYPKLEGSMLLDLSGHLTNTDALCAMSNHLGITDLIKTRRVLNCPSNSEFIAKVFCAVVGAVYENKGPKAARAFVKDFIIAQLTGKDIHDVIKLQHPRHMLYTILKSQGLAKPEPRLLKETGVATHFPTFQVGVYCGEKMLGEGYGSSKKRAEREAMVSALVSQFKTQLSNAPLPSDEDIGYTEEESPEITEQ